MSRLTDQELLAQVSMLAQREREATAALVAHLAVLGERRLYLGEGCSSLFAYCIRVLHLSENAAYRRVEAARVARAYPMVLDVLSDGSISLTTLRVLAPELTPANHRQLLEREKLAATDRPRASRSTDSCSRHIPADVRRAVWRRDGGQCASAAPNGRRRPDRGFLQFHHREPYSVGGAATVENIELTCAVHSRYEADLFFGPRGSPMAPRCQRGRLSTRSGTGATAEAMTSG